MCYDWKDPFGVYRLYIIVNITKYAELLIDVNTFWSRESGQNLGAKRYSPSVFTIAT